MVLTYGYWQRRFGGVENIVGQTLAIDGRPGEVIGVLPASFTFLRTRPEIVLPMPLDASAPRNISFGFQALARLKPGVTLAQANADVARLISLLPPAFARLELRPDVRPLADDVIGNVGEILWILLAAVGVVLLIACGNVANLFLVRAEGRQQELAMRAALGASRGRIRRALLAESVVLALAGGMVGVALAWAAIALLRTIAPAELPRVDDIGIDLTVLLFTFVVSVLSGRRVRPVCRLAIRKSEHRGAERGRPVGKRCSRATPHTPCPGRGTSRTGADAADRLGVDDSHVRRAAAGRSRLHPPRGSPDVRHRDPARPHQR